MGHWRRLIKIPGGTDCYYCINHMTYSTHVSYCPFIFVPIPDMLSTIMSPYTLLHSLIFVTLHVLTHYLCRCILRIAYILLYVYVADFITVCAQHSSNMVMLHTTHLHIHFHHIINIQQYFLYNTGYYCRHDSLRPC